MVQSARLKINYLIAKYLWGERRRAQKTRIQVAWKIGITPGQVLEYEQGTRPVPLYRLAKLMEFYGANFEEMVNFIHSIPAEAHRTWRPEEYAKIAHHRLKVQYEDLTLDPSA